AAGFAYGRIVRDGFSLAIVGRPNAGKSSLFNRLVQRERAIVTATPGTTRDLVTERVSLGGIPIDLMDTAGIREAADEAESLGIQKSREAVADADVVLLVLDASQSQVDAHELELLQQIADRRALVVWNKIDLQPIDLQSATKILEEFSLSILRTSAVTGEGVAALQEKILEMVRGNSVESESGLVTNLRQQQAIVAALEALSAAQMAVVSQVPHEMLLLDLYNALRALDALTGQTTIDDILNQIFSTFCIGK
ncbi:MAG TPA: GTPase, partial [Acidobacteriaceae bacterium]|nr:GTPase [Acidobacteriaceae bacterium]